MGQSVALHITVVILAGPDVTAFALHHIGNHIVDQTVFVPESAFLEFSTIMFFVDLLKEVLEATIVFLHDSILGGHVNRVITVQTVLETLMGELGNRRVQVVHGHTDTRGWEVEYIISGGRLAGGRGEDDLEFSRFSGQEICGTILITESMTADHDWFLPLRN